jgi:excisionase family DNA binding protein
LPRRNYRQNVRLTSRDIADYCQVSKSTVLEWIKSKELKAFRLPSGHYRIEKKDFKSFLVKWDMPVNTWLFKDDNADGGNRKQEP